MPDQEHQPKNVSSRAIEIIDIKDARSLVSELSPLAPRWRGSHHKLRPVDWRFRGHGDAAWSLVPSALREGTMIPGSGTPKLSTELRSSQVDQETTALREFVVQADATGLPVPGASDILQTLTKQKERLWNYGFRASVGAEGSLWPPDHLLDAFALAQHYGVPTRLLDWTELPLVAAYFAAIDASSLRDRVEAKRGGILPEKLAVWAFNRPFFLRLLEWPTEAGRFALVRSPRSQNANLNAQGGVFTVDRWPGPAGVASFKPPALEDAISEAVDSADEVALRDLDPYMPGLVKLTLGSENAGCLLKLLYDHRVNAATVFPGYAGVARALTERAFYDHSDPDPALDKPS